MRVQAILLAFPSALLMLVDALLLAHDHGMTLLGM
jgi:hypothetical protein